MWMIRALKGVATHVTICNIRWKHIKTQSQTGSWHGRKKKHLARKYQVYLLCCNHNAGSYFKSYLDSHSSDTDNIVMKL